MLLPATYQSFCISEAPQYPPITTQPSSFGPAVGVSDLTASKAFYVRSPFSLGVEVKSVAFTSAGLYRPAKADDPLETSVAPRCDACASQRIYRSSSRSDPARSIRRLELTRYSACHNGRERRQAADVRSGERGKSRNIGSIHGRFHLSQFTVMSAAENATQATMPLGPDRKSGSLQGT